MFFHKHKKEEPKKNIHDPEKEKKEQHRKVVNATVEEMEHNEWKNHSGAG